MNLNGCRVPLINEGIAYRLGVSSYSFPYVVIYITLYNNIYESVSYYIKDSNINNAGLEFEWR